MSNSGSATAKSSEKETAKKRAVASSVKQAVVVPRGAPSMAALQRAVEDPRTPPQPAEILALQRRYGNRAVQRLLANRTLQAKLTVGAANDPYEQEADRVAAQVMSAPAPSPTVQRLDEEEDEVQAKPLATSITPLVQRLVGAEGTAEEGKPVPFVLEEEFITKHVAKDATEAKTVTEARIATGDPPGMVAGTAPNNLATKANWEKVINANKEIVPPEESGWVVENGDYDGGDHVERLATVTVDGWEAKGTKDKVQVVAKKYKISVGGTWKVTGAEFDDADNPTTPGNVSLPIYHVTSPM